MVQKTPTTILIEEASVKKIFYLITGLHPGGAERMLQKIIKHTDKKKYEIVVCGITPGGVIGEELKKIVPVHTLGVKSVFGFFTGLFRLRSLLKKEKPDVLHCFMFHSNILGRLAGIGIPCKIISSIRVKLLGNKVGNFFDRLTQGLVDVYMVNARALETFIRGYGVRKKIVLVENGLEFDRFVGLKKEGSVRRELKLGNRPTLTMIANPRRQKDYPTMLQALSIVQKEVAVNFLAVGGGTEHEDETNKLKKVADELGLKHVTFTGYRKDIPEVLGVTDVWVSSTLFEGQSNSLLEGMYAKKAIVTTDISENAEVIEDGKEGLLVPTKNPKLLAKAILRILKDKKLGEKLGTAAHKKAKKKYDIKKTVKNLDALYEKLLG